ncbi:glycosyltransferase [Gordonia pseudamarae]|jgi:GT2 family glycosyltransferase|uniref:Glycosyltransferase n=1 Tax=Gordonia pseudamarae TaxID=2831662 RepID=A0ABX6IJV3_9ACTN|nr:glycosyltransferase [Gordonia sp. (in: high G+C Gram-positive bacteria)]MBD0021319.1 glycosyltransferase [Gordonia sp. (in: high G+C Gram-positive bacteria)]QHN26502.1 glycosyltransferase [Gordonia pseudamarae]QHN35396.1 glycosyltransferase [Gordonia pseudamarae]
MIPEVTLTSPMPSGGTPSWPGAAWIGVADISQLIQQGHTGQFIGVTTDAEAYTIARILIRDGLIPLEFAQVPLVDGCALLPIPAIGERRDAGALPPMSVVLCTRERPDDLRGALASLLLVDYPEFEIIVVDNAPITDGTEQVVTAIDDPRVRRVVEPVAGLSMARNAGIRAARHEIIAFTDDDVVADQGWLRGLATGFAQADDVACVAGLVPSGELRTMPQAYFDWRVSWADNIEPRMYRLSDPPDDVPLFPFQIGRFGTGANFAIRRKIIIDLGMFDERLGAGTATCGGEDLDVFFRVVAAGHCLATEPTSIIWHRHRSDDEALLKQARGYGMGLGAWLTKVALDSEHRRLALSVLRHRGRAVARAGKAYCAIAAPPPAFLRDVPRSVGRTEVLSVVRGPAALWREQRRQRARQTRPPR